MVPASQVTRSLDKISLGHRPPKHPVPMKAKQPNQNRPVLKPAEEGVKPQPPAKEAYRKPALKRLGLLKAVAGSGVHF